MGVINSVVCTGCGKSWELLTGCGMRHGSLNVIAEAYPREVAAQILAHTSKKPYVAFHFAMRLAECRGCKTLLTVPVLRIKESDEVYIGSCFGCGEKVTLIEEVEKAACPVCQQMKLSSSSIGNWD